MKIPFPQTELRGTRGGSDTWDDQSAGVIISDEYFGLEKIGTVIDDFNDNSIDLAKWYTYLNAATITETGQRIEINLTPNTVGAEGDLISAGDFTLRSSSVFVTFLQAATPGVDSLFSVQSEPGNRLMWLLTATTAQAYVQDGYSTISSGSSIGITPGASLAFRIREILGRVYFDYSIDGGATWTNSHSESVSNIPWEIGDISALVAAYEYSGTGATTQSVSVFDNFNILAGGGSFSQTCTETIVLNDSVLRTTSRRLTDAIVIVDTVRKLPSRTLIDALTIVDTIRKTSSRSLIDSLTLVDTVAGKITARLFTEAIVLVDTVSKSTSRLITEVVTLVDSIIRTTTRTFTEAIALVDTFAGIKITTKALVESIVLVDTMTKFTSRTITETLILVDTLRRTTTRLFTEAITLVDTVAKAAGRSFTEVISLVDTVAKLTTRRLTEAIVLVDTVIRTTTRRFLEAITLVDTFAFSRILSRSYSETITLADSIAKTTSKVARETITLVDTFLGEIVVLVIKSIGNWILYALTGLNKILKLESKAHTLSTTKQSHMVLLSERSFTVSATKTTHTNRSNTTP